MYSQDKITSRKIILVVPSLSGGGAEKVASILCESLQQSDPGLELLLILFREESTNTFLPNTRIVCLNVNSQRGLFYTMGRFFRVIYNLYAIFKREHPCTILSFMDYSNLVSIIANRLSGNKNRIIISVHTQPTAQMRTYAAGIWEKTLGVLIKRFYNMADGIIAVSAGIGNDLANNFNVDRDLIHIISNPFDLQKISRLSEEELTEKIFEKDFPVILSAGRLSKEKGFVYLLKAFSLLQGKAEARLVILGEGKEKQQLEKLSRTLGIEKNVFFLGYKKNPFKYMKHSAVFVLPSIYEGFGNVIVEAMACGVPVVATRCYDGIDEILRHKRTGLLVDAQDEHAISQAILTLLNDSELRRSIAKEAKKSLDRFSIDKITKKYRVLLGPHC